MGFARIASLLLLKEARSLRRATLCFSTKKSLAQVLQAFQLMSTEGVFVSVCDTGSERSLAFQLQDVRSKLL